MTCNDELCVDKSLFAGLSFASSHNNHFCYLMFPVYEKYQQYYSHLSIKKPNSVVLKY